MVGAHVLTLKRAFRSPALLLRQAATQRQGGSHSSWARERETRNPESHRGRSRISMSIFPTEILLATDGSKDAWLATNTAIGLAMVTRSELHVVNVGAVAPALLASFVKPARAEQVARRVLDEEVNNIENVGGTVARSHLRTGNAAQEIVDLAEELKAGLIALGSRGRKRTKRPLLGGVSDKVVRH